MLEGCVLGKTVLAGCFCIFLRSDCRKRGGLVLRFGCGIVEGIGFWLPFTNVISDIMVNCGLSEA